MSVAEGAIGGASQGMAVGSMFGPQGAVIGAVIGAVGGIIKGLKSKKKIKQAEQARAEAMANAVKMINGRRERANQHLSEQEQYRDQMVGKIMGHYYDVKEAWGAMSTEQQALITSKHGDIMGQLDTGLKTQLSLSDDVFKATTEGITKMQDTYLPALKKDIEGNAELREEFSGVINKSIEDTQAVGKEARTALDTLKQTGKPVGAENREARLEQRFNDAERNYDKMNPNQVGAEQQKLSNKFKLAMAEGDLSAQEQEQADRQQAVLRGEIANNSANLINQARARQQGMTNNDGTTYAQAQIGFQEQAMNARKEELARQMGFQDANSLARIRAITDKYNSMQEVKEAVARGEINAQDAMFMSKIGAENDFNKVRSDVFSIHSGIDQELQSMYMGGAQQASQDIANIRQDSKNSLNAGISGLMYAGVNGKLDGVGGAVKDRFNSIFKGAGSTVKPTTGYQIGGDNAGMYNNYKAPVSNGVLGAPPNTLGYSNGYSQQQLGDTSRQVPLVSNFSNQPNQINPYEMGGYANGVLNPKPYNPYDGQGYLDVNIVPKR